MLDLYTGTYICVVTLTGHPVMLNVIPNTSDKSELLTFHSQYMYLSLHSSIYLSLSFDALHISSEEGMSGDNVDCPHSSSIYRQSNLELHLYTIAQHMYNS